MSDERIGNSEDLQPATKPRRRFNTFSIKSLLILTTLVAFGIFLLGETTITITIPHDKGAWTGGVPKTGNQIDVFGGAEQESRWVVEDAVVAGSPQWSFRDGIAMKLDVSMKRYQAWPMGGFKYCRIVNKK